jgi:exopolysaccharide biosynthesis polyprenyl glycosylphosphotransferase
VYQELATAAQRGDLRAHHQPEPAPVKATTKSVFGGERWRLVALDAAIIVAASFLAGSSWAPALIRAVSTVLVFAAVGLYRTRLQYSALDEVPRLLLGVAVVLPLGAWLPVPDLMTPKLFVAAPIAWPAAVLAGVLVGRAVVYQILNLRRRRLGGESTIVIGTGDMAIRLTEVLTGDKTFGLAPLGLVGAQPLTEPELPAPLLGSVDEVETIVAKYQPRNVVVAYPGPGDAELVGALRQWRRLGIAVYVVPRLFEMALGRGSAELVHGVPLVRMRPEPPRRWRRAAKRLLDIAGAGFGLVVLSPVFAACALAVRFESRRSGVLFKQERIGRDGKPFTIMKFRSLTPSSDKESQMKWNIAQDDRVGKVGRILRSTSLDELPQLVNVLRGDMSLVGPRPERPYFVEQFTRTYGGYMDRHRVVGGITGWAQIHGLRGDTSIEERTRFDNYYIENWSLALDIKIIIRTFTSMLSLHRR